MPAKKRMKKAVSTRVPFDNLDGSEIPVAQESFWILDEFAGDFVKQM